MAKTVIGLYRDMNTAQQVVRELQNSGFRREDISLVARDPRGEPAMRKADEDVTEGAMAGAGIGAALGGIGGLLVGLGALTIPGIGPIVAAGPLATALAGAGIGAVAGGVVGALADLGVPEQDAHAYAEGVRRGGVLVAVRTTDDRSRQAADVLNRHDPVDVRREAGNWRQEGWNRFDETARPLREDELTLPIVQEELRVGKRAEERGVRVRTDVTEEPVEERVRLRDEHVDVERRRVDRPATEDDMAAFREGSFEVRETHEEPVVQKQARVVEEIHVRKDVDEREETVRDTVRRTDVHTEDMGTTRRTRDTGFDMFENDFRRHYQSNYAGGGHDYNTYRSAYLHGYTLHRESDCNGDCRWEDIERQARGDWERSNPDNAWEEFKDAVREGWDSLTGRK